MVAIANTRIAITLPSELARDCQGVTHFQYASGLPGGVLAIIGQGKLR